MTMMVTEVYDALMSAGADEAKLRRAAEVLTDYDSRFDRLEHHVDERFSAQQRQMDERFTEQQRQVDQRFKDVDVRFARLERQLAILKWQVGALFAMFTAVNVPTLWLVLRLSVKVGALP